MTMRFLSSPCLLDRFGHLGQEPEWLIKARALGLIDDCTFAISTYGRTKPVVNACLLDYWCQYVEVTGAPADPEALIDSYPGNFQLFVDGTAISRWRGRDLVHAQWDAAGLPPLLTITAAHRAASRATLATLGLPADAWFVALDVREAGFLGAGYHDHRNADVLTYLPAIAAIVDRGGWVVRVGHPSTVPLPVLPQVIDYAHSAVRSESLDVYLLGDCRFLLGTNSGPTNVANAFGTPVCGTNWTPAGMGAFRRGDLYIPKLYAAGARVFSYAETLQSPARGYNAIHEYRQAGLTIVDNTPDEIAAVVDEMLGALEGDAHRDGRFADARATYQRLLEAEDTWGTLGALGQDFMLDDLSQVVA